MNNEDLILVEQFCLHHNIEITFITALKEFGLIEIVIAGEKQYLSAEQLATVEKMVRLHYELEINLEGIDVIINLLSRIESLQQDLNAAQNKLKLSDI